MCIVLYYNYYKLTIKFLKCDGLQLTSAVQSPVPALLAAYVYVIEWNFIQYISFWMYKCAL